MDKSYTKLFHRILASSIWDEDDKTRLVWITMLASSDERGEVVATLSKLSRDARVEPSDCQAALVKFLSPDPSSLTRANDGRRIEAIEGGWRLLNHLKYREMMTAESRREYFRNKRREYRRREKDLRRGMTAREIVREGLQNER